MKLIVVLHGYDPDKAEELEGAVQLILEAAEVPDASVFEVVPAIGADGPYLEIIVERKSSVYPIIEQFYVQRVYEKLEIAGAVTFFFTAGDLISTEAIKKASRYQSELGID